MASCHMRKRVCRQYKTKQKHFRMPSDMLNLTGPTAVRTQGSACTFGILTADATAEQDRQTTCTVQIQETSSFAGKAFSNLCSDSVILAVGLFDGYACCCTARHASVCDSDVRYCRGPMLHHAVLPLGTETPIMTPRATEPFFCVIPRPEKEKETKVNAFRRHITGASVPKGSLRQPSSSPTQR